MAESWQYKVISVRQASREESTGLFSKRTIQEWTAEDRNGVVIGGPAPSIEELLNPLGGQGWELVSVVPHHGDYQDWGHLYHFKRRA